LKQLAEGIDNVVLHGRVPHEKMGEYFNKSYLLCSTSVYEGFPNIYLEAWSVGLPLVTTFDPDGVVREFGLGRIAHDVETLRTAVAGLLSEADWEKAASAAESYFFNHHTLSSSMVRFEGAFKKPNPLE
jgi:glycosyltransferase involved in cell wall biosynthesis